MEKQYDNEKTGYLWHESGSKVLRKGSLTLDGKKHYVAIVESANDKGESKYEFMVSTGLLHLNDEESKLSPNSPDIGGAITMNGRTYKLGGWRKQSGEGTEYTSISLKEREQETEKGKSKF